MVTKTEESSETENQAKTVWTLLCATITGSGSALFCSLVWGRVSRPITLLITLGSVAVGAMLAFRLRNSKQKRKISLFVSLGIFAIFVAFGLYLASDFALVKRKWRVYNLGLTTFSYPADFKQKALPLNFLQNGEVFIFTNENAKRYATYMIYEFNDYYPELSESLSSAVLSLLSSFKATFDSWEENEESKANALKFRFNYTLHGKKYTGIAYAASDVVDEQNARYELLMFFPLKKKYSPKLMERIENEIKLR